MHGKFFIIGVYSYFDCALESFRPCEKSFDSFQSCIDWIETHKKYFSGSVHFGIFNIDNKF